MSVSRLIIVLAALRDGAEIHTNTFTALKRRELAWSEGGRRGLTDTGELVLDAYLLGVAEETAR